MIARKALTEIVIYAVAMPAAVGLCLWVLLGQLRIDQYLSLPLPTPDIARTATVVPVPVAETDSRPAAAAPVPAAIADPGPATVAPVPATKADAEPATVVLFPGDDGRLLAQLQAALVGKGYSVGSAGADGNDDTLTALEAFQSDNALPLQPSCDQQCRTALGLPDLR